MTAEMRLFQLSDVEDLQFVEAVVGPLNEGIVSISNIYKSLLDAQVDPLIDTCSNYEQIRGYIKNAERYLKKSETTMKEKLAYLDECMEGLAKEKENVEQQYKEKCMAKDKLNTEKNSTEESLKNSKAALEQAEKSLVSAKYALRVHQDRKSTYEGVANAGAALLAIPVIGWIPGLIMLCNGSHVIGETSKAIRDAEDEVKENESQVNESSMKVSNYQSRISSIQNEIEETDKVLNKTQRKIKEMKQHLEVTENIQNIVRRAVNLLSDLSGKVTVLERQTQHSILWQPVMNVMEDVVKAAENPFLYSQGVGKGKGSDVWPSMVAHTRGQPAANAPREQLGVQCLAQGSHLSCGIEGGESTGYSLPPPTIPAGPEIRIHDLQVTSPTLYPLGQACVGMLEDYRLYETHPAILNMMVITEIIKECMQKLANIHSKKN